MLHVHYSDSLEALLERLGERVAAHPFSLTEPATILVPNANVAKWLKMQLAQRNGVAMNVNFPYLERGLWEQTCRLTGIAPGTIQPTSAEQSRFAVAARLVVALEHNQHNPLTDFCLNGHTHFSRHDPDQIRRVWQLSTDLSRLYREYEYHRGLSPLDSSTPPRSGMRNDRDLIGFWLDPANALDHVPDSLLPSAISGDRRSRLQQLFAAQGALYREAVQALRDGSPPELSLPSLARQTTWESLPTTASTPPIHLFGISQLSPFHCWLLHHLGRHQDLHLYHFNICREFWEDTQTPGELRRSLLRTGIKADELDLQIENELLNAWGKSGRETIRLLGGIEELGEAHFEWLPNPTPHPQTLLGQVQLAIATRTSDLTPLPGPDPSMERIASPSIQREVETVHNHIIGSLIDDPTLKQTDIAILVPRMEGYRTAFSGIFDARQTLDYNLVDATAGSESVLAKGILNALALVNSPFSRRQVIELLANPCVMQAMHTSEDELETWIQWTDTLGIFHHFDAAHRTNDDLPAAVHFTWLQGLRRLRLGRIMESGPDASPFPDHPPHADMWTTDQTLDRFSVWLTRLYRRLQQLQQSQTAEAWTTTLNAFIDTFFAIPRERPQEEQVLASIQGTLRTLAGSAGTLGFGAHLERAGSTTLDLPLEWVRQYLTDAISTIPAGRGAYLTGGVTIASLLPMRPVPFRRVYMLGLGEGEFPGHDATPTLDLRTCRRRIGDTSHSDTGRYLFLETLMATRERLCLSYVHRDIKKDEEKQPCSVLLQLQACIDQHLLPDTSAWPTTTTPLNSYSVGLLTAESATHHQWGLEQQLLAYVAQPAADPQTLASNAPGTLLTHAAISALQQPEQTDPTDPHPTPEQLSLHELACFLKDPADALLRYRYGIYDTPTEESTAIEDEPLESDITVRYAIGRDALSRAFIASDPSVGESYIAEQLTRRSHASQGPDRDFLPFDIEGFSALIRDRVGKSDSKNPFLTLRDLKATTQRPDPKPRSLQIDLGARGTTTLIREPRTLEVSLPHHDAVIASLAIPVVSISSGTGLPSNLIADWLELLHRTASLSHRRSAQRWLCLIVSRNKKKSLDAYRTQLSPEEAQHYLANLITEYLHTSELELFPYKLVQDACTTSDGTPLPGLTPEMLLTAADNAQGPYGSYSPPDIVKLNRDSLRVPDALAERITTRLGLLLGLRSNNELFPPEAEEAAHG